MNNADRLRYFAQRSNTLHQRYLENSNLLVRYERFVTWQREYMLPHFEELRENNKWRPAIDFIVSDLAGIGISDRDQQIQRVIPAIIRLLPAKALQAIASGMEMNARILEINLSICEVYVKQYGEASEFTENKYCHAAREAVTLEECLELITLTKSLGQDLERIVKIPFIGITLKSMRIPARLAGFADLQLFLEDGYTAFTKLDNVATFLDSVEANMRLLFERIYTTPLTELQH